MHVLIVLTSHDQLGDTGEKTGFWLEEFAAPYYRLLDAGAELTLASPAGGQPPLDPKSSQPDAQTDATRRFNADTDAQATLANTARLPEVSADHYDGVFYPGGHGPLWDLAVDKDSISLIESFLQQGKPVAAVCHAPAVLVNAKAQNGEALVKGRQVTGFSNSEEAAVGLTEVVPFLLEERLQSLGGTYSAGEDWHPHAVVDGLLITGQNPGSSEITADHLLAALKSK
ncbi:MAG: type 1 glutamine amidotransferase domain-containing protein [Halioglobus sp.]